VAAKERQMAIYALHRYVQHFTL